MWPFSRQKITAKAIFDDQSVILKQLIKGFPIKVVDQLKHADLIWTANRADEVYKNLQPYQLWNHLTEELAIVDKGNLLTHLKEFDKKNISYLKLAEVMPDSYLLFVPEERGEFIKNLPTKNEALEPWIIKPTGLSRGKGVFIMNDYDEIREFCQNNTEPTHQKHVIQKYIKNVLSLEERKSEARLYWLIASLNPLLVLLYKHGTIRLNTLPYKLDEFDNNLIHIGNVYQQKRFAHYDPFLTLKWNFAQLDQYLLDHYHVTSYTTNKLIPRVKEYIKLILKASEGALLKQNSPGCHFGLYGIDIIIDDKLHPWLTEIQFGPGLAFKDEIKKKIIPPLIKDTFKVMLEIQKRKRQGQLFSDFSDVGDFEWVIGSDDS
jgi:hypothetical protein